MVENSFKRYIGLFIFYIPPHQLCNFYGSNLNFWAQLTPKDNCPIIKSQRVPDNPKISIPKETKRTPYLALKMCYCGPQQSVSNYHSQLFNKISPIYLFRLIKYQKREYYKHQIIYNKYTPQKLSNNMLQNLP